VKKIYSIIVITFFLLRTSSSFAWGSTGHHIVAQVAKAYLEPGVEDSVKKYFGSMTFESASTWMDAIRSDHSYDYMKPWHYVNIEEGQTYIETGDPNVINALEEVVKKLVEKEPLSNADLFFNLKVLFHLVGDLHQPLHVGYGVDLGGNTVDVHFLSTSTNLHRVWDSDIINNKNITYAKCLAIASGLPAEEITEIQNIDVMEWMLQSRALLDSVYDFSGVNITQPYIDKNAPLIERQIVAGGLRLASVLNERFSAKTTTGISNPVLVPQHTYISVYPNPFTYSTQFSIVNCPSSAELSIVNILGETIKTFAHPAANFEFQRDELPEGIYFYYLYDQEKVIRSGKFIITN
jgi:hypothetical protein